ncbi:hypothetical protein BCPG_04857 [Burkholderia cenocepacia PC184]|nr:hypothetical protein BCPG_04857 [Burkholderia cenocepacia PC184]
MRSTLIRAGPTSPTIVDFHAAACASATDLKSIKDMRPAPYRRERNALSRAPRAPSRYGARACRQHSRPAARAATRAWPDSPKTRRIIRIAQIKHRIIERYHGNSRQSGNGSARPFHQNAFRSADC